MRSWQRTVKRILDVNVAACGLFATGPLILLLAAIARWDTGKSGFFRQRRVGQAGKLFHLVKIRTMRDVAGVTTTATTATDPRITSFGQFLRRFKLDELPQLWNVLWGEMSLVGPRPDVPELLATISDVERKEILAVRPGITGPATLRYRCEEQLLAIQPNPEHYNREVIFPDKVRINRQYVRGYRLIDDVRYLFWTVFPRLMPAELANHTPEPAPYPASRAAA